MGKNDTFEFSLKIKVNKITLGEKFKKKKKKFIYFLKNLVIHFSNLKGPLENKNCNDTIWRVKKLKLSNKNSFLKYTSFLCLKKMLVR